ncbi:RING finger protein 112-like isoform X2 [Hyla sarda]|uniref:RING finger protein 112-like isoform X2 n=1 Tax=Hyla sarda TaxID=327740 RepID=UPI0024C42361|nr:RING finger protein 112-like isoform X2 [Hyla sarda]
MEEIPGSPCLLVYQDDSDVLQLNMETVQRCFIDCQIDDYPLCLLFVIGEKRCGKSFLMNYTLRALYNQERGAAIGADIMGDENERLTGFEWKNGADSVTKGIWIWDRPIILERNGEKMAVFILDTEGSLDTDRDQEISNKLSALSLFLSSYMIFNVNKGLKTTELDLLEIYEYIQECLQSFVNFNLIENSSAGTQLESLDILVRDWNNPGDCGREAGRRNLDHEIQKLMKSTQRDKIIQVLQTSSVRSFLLPHPGNKFLQSEEGNLKVMDEIFRNHFTTYISELLTTIWNHPKTDTRGNYIKCGDLIQYLEKFVNFLRMNEFNFGSPKQMYFSLKNVTNKNNITKRLDIFLENVDPPVNNVLEITPSAMRSMVEDEIRSLQSEYRNLLLTDSEDKKKNLIEDLKSELKKKMEMFCSKYSEKYKWRCDEENRRNKDIINSRLEDFMEEKRSLLCEGFMIKPSALRSDIEAKIISLLAEYGDLLLTDSEEEKRRLVDVLQYELEEKQETFCLKYSIKFKEQCDEKNLRTRENMTKELQDFLKEKNPKWYKILRMKPSKMKSIVEDEIRSLQSTYGDLLLTDSEEEKRHLMDDLESELKEKQTKFLSKYYIKYAAVVGGAVGAGVLTTAGAAVGGVIAGGVIAEVALGVEVAAVIPAGGAILGGALGGGLGVIINHVKDWWRRNSNRNQNGKQNSRNVFRQNPADDTTPLLQ